MRLRTALLIGFLLAMFGAPPALAQARDPFQVPAVSGPPAAAPPPAAASGSVSGGAGPLAPGQPPPIVSPPVPSLPRTGLDLAAWLVASGSLTALGGTMRRAGRPAGA